MSDGTDFPSTTWTVKQVASFTDGDTLRLVRVRPLHWDGRNYLLVDNEPKGVPHRLVWVDTPERDDHPGWEDARADLVDWYNNALAKGGVAAVVYGSGGWDRLLVNLLDCDGESCSEWLMKERGWPPYEE